MKMNLQSQVLMFLMERCIVSCRSKRLSSRLQHICSNNSAIHGKDIKPKGTSSNRGSWINKALITGIKKKHFREETSYQFLRALSSSGYGLQGSGQQLGYPSTPPAHHDQDRGPEHLLTKIPWPQGSGFLAGYLCEQTTCVLFPKGRAGAPPTQTPPQGHWMEGERTKETASALSASINPYHTRGERTFYFITRGTWFFER